MQPLSYSDIKKDFDESLGYVRQDIRWLIAHDCGLNYTVALLIGCGCEMLAAGEADKKRRGEKALAQLLPAGDWQLMADVLYTALRDGLAHGFDTKHISVDNHAIQIYISWNHRSLVEIGRANGGVGLFVGVQALAEALCAKIDAYETRLRHDEAARTIHSLRPRVNTTCSA